MKTLTEAMESANLTRFQAVQFLELTGLGQPSIRGKRTYYHIDKQTEGYMKTLSRYISQGNTICTSIKKMRKAEEL